MTASSWHMVVAGPRQFVDKPARLSGDTGEDREHEKLCGHHHPYGPQHEVRRRARLDRARPPRADGRPCRCPEPSALDSHELHRPAARRPNILKSIPSLDLRGRARDVWHRARRLPVEPKSTGGGIDILRQELVFRYYETVRRHEVISAQAKIIEITPATLPARSSLGALYILFRALTTPRCRVGGGSFIWAMVHRVFLGNPAAALWRILSGRRGRPDAAVLWRVLCPRHRSSGSILSVNAIASRCSTALEALKATVSGVSSWQQERHNQALQDRQSRRS